MIQRLLQRYELLKPYRAHVLWGILLSALIVNIAFLWWPQIPETLIITPDPLALQHSDYSQQPVLVTAPDTAEGYMLIEHANPEAPQKISTIHPHTRHAAAARPSKKQFKGIVHLNTAVNQQLQQLPGVGPKMAQRILDYRKTHGGFRDINELLAVDGIGPKTFSRLQPHCSL